MSDLAREISLRCSACSHEQGFDPFIYRCPDCNEALEIPAGPAPPALEPAWPLGLDRAGAGIREGMWRYRSVLPAVDGELIARRVRLGEGGTPLLSAPRLAEAVGCRAVWLKDESRNPTGSFKDRGTAVGVAVLASLGFNAVGTVSTGNMARSVAAYAARAEMRASVWVGADTPAEKLAPIAVHGADLLRFDAPYGEIYASSMEWGRAEGVPFVNSDSSLRVEGQKTISYELAEQLGGRTPDWFIVPTSSGGNLSAIAKGFDEAVAWGWLERPCRLVAVQAEGCAPIARAWEAGADDPVAVDTPRTIAGAIVNPTPPSGSRALRWLRRVDGVAVAVSDAEILDAQLRVARLTGRYVQPASASSLAALERLRRDGTVGPEDGVALLLTGSGRNAPAPPLELPPAGDLSRVARGA